MGMPPKGPNLPQDEAKIGAIGIPGLGSKSSALAKSGAFGRVLGGRTKVPSEVLIVVDFCCPLMVE